MFSFNIVYETLVQEYMWIDLKPEDSSTLDVLNATQSSYKSKEYYNMVSIFCILKCLYLSVAVKNCGPNICVCELMS